MLGTEPGLALHDVLLDPEPPLLAPGLLWIEVARVLRAKLAAGALSRAGAEAALADFLDLGIDEISIEPLIVRAWELRDNVTVDDAVFVALAEATAQSLVTTDLRLASAVRDRTHVEVLTHLDA